MAASAVAALHIQRGPSHTSRVVGRGRDPRGGPCCSAGAPGMANVYEHVTPGDAGSGAGRIGTAIPGERARVEFQRAGKAHGDGPEAG